MRKASLTRVTFEQKPGRKKKKGKGSGHACLYIWEQSIPVIWNHRAGRSMPEKAASEMKQSRQGEE